MEDQPSLAITKWSPKRVYYTPTGRKLVLPADSYSQEHYLAKGFTFTPPANPLKEKVFLATVEDSNIESPPQVTPKRKWHRKRKYKRREVEE